MINFISALKSVIIGKEATSESVIVAKDTKELFMDIQGTRIHITDIIHLETEDDMNDILAPLSNKFYFIKETNCLYNYNNNTWIPVSDCVTMEDIDKIIDSLE